ncbi:MAG: hypothetical protein AAGI52_05640 [Bacteroidota bacterium]
MSTAASPRRHRTAAEVNAAGIDALVRALGVADAARFLQQYGPGLGNYTEEREALIGDLSLEDMFTLADEEENPSED